MRNPEQRTPLLWLVLPVVAGLVTAAFLPHAADLPLLLVGCLAGTAALLLAWRTPVTPDWSFPVAFAIGAFFLAASLFLLRQPDHPEWRELPQREAELELRVTRLFLPRENDDRLRGFGRVVHAPEHLWDLKGERLYFALDPPGDTPTVRRHARLTALGVLTPLPEGSEVHSFDRFLRRSGIGFRLVRGSFIEIVRPPPKHKRAAQFVSERFEEILRLGSRPSQAGPEGVYVAMLLGKRQELSEEQRAGFLQSGTFHLFAISGLHIGVIALALRTLCNLCRLTGRTGAAVGLGTLLLYVEVTGSSPSAVRAFLMVAFFWGARLFARQPHPLAALANSAACVLLLFPHQVWNLGFQLSYLVVTGILLLGLPLGERIRKQLPYPHLPEKDIPAWKRLLHTHLISGMTTSLGVSLAAVLVSSPLSIAHFGVFAPGAVFLNLILIPMAFLVISAGFLSILLGLSGLGFLSEIFNHGAWMVIRAMEGTVSISSFVPGFFWKAEFRTEWAGAMTTSVLLLFLFLGAALCWPPRSFPLVMPFAFFSVVLALGVALTFPN